MKYSFRIWKDGMSSSRIEKSYENLPVEYQEILDKENELKLVVSHQSFHNPNEYRLMNLPLSVLPEAYHKFLATEFAYKEEFVVKQDFPFFLENESSLTLLIVINKTTKDRIFFIKYADGENVYVTSRGWMPVNLNSLMS